MTPFRQLIALMVSSVMLGVQAQAAEESLRAVGQPEAAASAPVVEQAAMEEAPADKYAVAADGRDLSTSISHEVGRAPYFIILSETGELVEVIQNPYLELKYGLGPIVADMLAEKEVTVLIGGFAGPNMHSKLKSSGIRFTHGKGGVKQVVNSLRPEVH